ncbi:hypothetical protein BpHYR1_043701 [Brachionus plicatilis]|uniref:Uncharacterized protein n=1 Tax=Brachionus plicatilis TaxID=10195 RepID=A0A3M7T4F5_BRAPC|nr:hypothetical protein BpHYR1_043701 [Brachionus plicatilis]
MIAFLRCLKGKKFLPVMFDRNSFFAATTFIFKHSTNHFSIKNPMEHMLLNKLEPRIISTNNDPNDDAKYLVWKLLTKNIKVLSESYINLKKCFEIRNGICARVMNEMLIIFGLANSSVMGLVPLLSHLLFTRILIRMDII